MPRRGKSGSPAGDFLASQTGCLSLDSAAADCSNTTFPRRAFRIGNVERFLENLRRSKLLTLEQYQLARAAASKATADRPQAPLSADAAADALAPSPTELARSLVDEGLITRWQADMLLEGKKTFFLGKYKLLDCIGAGASGAVFKALHSELGRLVAIKILSAEVMRNRQAVARFRKEIQTVAALDDPHIVAAYDAGSVGGVHYLVMEYVEGHDLGCLLKYKGPLPVAFACECIRQAAQGLQYAHEKGMVHRDIKPTNLLLATDPESARPLIKILDLGLARFVSEAISADAPGSGRGGSDGSLTQFGQFLGTPDYIAPEQAQDTRQADIRSDIFSMGCTLFRLLTGQLPFLGETVAAKIEAREKTDACRLRSLRGDIPVELDAVVARMLAREPRSRYQTPREVAQALAPFTRRSGALPVVPAEVAATGGRMSRPPGDETRLDQIFRNLETVETVHAISVSHLATRWNRISPRVWLAVGAGLLSLLATAIAWEWFSIASVVIDWPLNERDGAGLIVDRRSVDLTNQSTISVRGRAGTRELHLEREGFEAIDKSLTLHAGERLKFTPVWRPTPRTQRKLRWQELQNRMSAIEATDVFSGPNVAMRFDLLSFSREHPTTAEAQAARLLSVRLRWPLDLVDRAQPTDHDFHHLATTGAGNSTVKPVGLFGDSRLKFWNGVVAIALSSDGRFLAGASRDGTVQVFDMADGRRRQFIVPSDAPTAVAFSPAEPMLAIAGETGPLTLWNVETGTRAAALADGTAPFAFSPDGSLIAVRSARQEIALWDARSGELRRTLPGHATGFLRGIVFSHAGRMLASYGSDSSVLLWDVGSGQERRRFPSAQSPLFSPDDAFLAAGATKGDLVLWDTRTGETQRTLDEGGYPIAFGTDGTTVISKRLGRAIVWNLTTGNELRTIIEVPELVAVSPSRKWLAGGDQDFGEIRLWNVVSDLLPHAQSTIGPVNSLVFSADSSTIVAGTRGNAMQVYDTASTMERSLAALPMEQADISPDGRSLAVRQGSQVHLLDMTTGTIMRTLGENAAALEALVFSPDGQTIAGFGGWGFFKTSLRLWDVTSGRELSLANEPLGTVRTLAFSPDARLLACAGDSRLVTIADMAQQSITSTLDDFSDRVTALAFHPDGRRLAVACQDQTLLLWDLKADSGKPFKTKQTVCRQLAFSPDGKLLAATGDGRVLVWTVNQDQAPTELATRDGEAQSLAFDPLGETLFAAGNTGAVWQWDAPAREKYRDDPDQVIQVGPAHGIIRRVLCSPDSRHILTVNGNGTIYVLRRTMPTRPDAPIKIKNRSKAAKK